LSLLSTEYPGGNGVSNTAFSRLPRAAGSLVIDYQPSQPTGWGFPEQRTLGGHTESAEFTYQDVAYIISLLSFGQAGDAVDPVYEAFPSDPTINFRTVLDTAWGSYYSFRYLGGVAGFSAESYSVFANLPTTQNPALTFGGDLYLVYQAEPSSEVVINGKLQFIQVVSINGSATGSAPASTVVNSGQDNPFDGQAGGLTSVNGDLIVGYYSRAQQGIVGEPPVSLAPLLVMSEVFMAQDTGMKDASGKDVVNILGGVKWGWQVQNGS
jgi:hypothetical protein